jgi:CheY-like chemotaxis protein
MSFTILLVDDDQDDVLFFSDALREVNADASMEHSGDAHLALDRLANGRFEPDLIFLDLHMPAINGWECLRQIKAIAKFRQTPIIMYSTANLHTSGFTPADVGAVAFYQKSNSFEQLKKDLAEMLSLIGR